MTKDKIKSKVLKELKHKEVIKNPNMAIEFYINPQTEEAIDLTIKETNEWWIEKFKDIIKFEEIYVEPHKGTIREIQNLIQEAEK